MTSQAFKQNLPAIPQIIKDSNHQKPTCAMAAEGFDAGLTKESSFCGFERGIAEKHLAISSGVIEAD